MRVCLFSQLETSFRCTEYQVNFGEELAMPLSKPVITIHNNGRELRVN